MKTVVITGANKGVGLQLTRLYAESGNKVIACCRDPDTAIDLKAQPGDIEIHRVEVGNTHSVKALGRELEGVPIDILINNAGTVGPAMNEQTISRMDFDQWEEAHNVNTMGPVRMLQELLGNLKAVDFAKVMTVTSQYAAISFDKPSAYAYSCTKIAINKFMRLAALDLVKEGIYVGLVHPGWVQTDMGGPKADLTPTESAAGIQKVIERLNIETTGSFWKWNGEEHAW